MKLYSDFSGRRTLQILGDAVALLVLLAGIVVAVSISTTIASFAAIGRDVEVSGNGFASTMDEIGDSLARVPLIGGGIRSPFDAAGVAGGTLADAGETWQQSVHALAAIAGWTVAALVVLTLFFGWFLPRAMGVTRRTRAARLASSPMSTDLLALRALTNRAPRDLTRIDPDIVGAWRRGDPEAMRQLAALELRTAGIRPSAPS